MRDGPAEIRRPVIVFGLRAVQAVFSAMLFACRNNSR
jgi:hypothetical protein